MSQFLKFAIAVGATSLFFATAVADTTVNLSGAVKVSGGTATATVKGGATYIRFVIENDGTDSFHLVNVTSPIADKVRLVGRVAPESYAVMESIGVPSGRVLDLTTSHLWYEAYPTQRPLHPGDTIEVTLRFVSGVVTIPIHVHAESPPCPTIPCVPSRRTS